jgi:hypothetical protein
VPTGLLAHPPPGPPPLRRRRAPAIQPMSMLISPNAANMTTTHGKVCLCAMLLSPPAWLVYNPATRPVLSSRNVVLDEATVLSMGESCRALEVPRIDDGEVDTPDS